MKLVKFAVLVFGAGISVGARRATQDMALEGELYKSHTRPWRKHCRMTLKRASISAITTRSDPRRRSHGRPSTSPSP